MQRARWAAEGGGGEGRGGYERRKGKHERRGRRTDGKEGSTVAVCLTSLPF